MSNHMTELHSFETFSVSRSIGGDYFIETDQGEEILILSPSGSDEHKQESQWIESKEREEADFKRYLGRY